MEKTSIKRYYVTEFDEDFHESTADLEIIDICNVCEYQRKYIVKDLEEEELTPPLMWCDICGVEIDSEL